MGPILYQWVFFENKLQKTFWQVSRFLKQIPSWGSEQAPCTHLKQLDPTAQIDVDVDVPSGNLT